MIKNDRRIRAEVVKIDLALDLAILKIESDIEPFNLMGESMVGEEIIVIGSPHGYENNVSMGIVGGVDRIVYTYPKAPHYTFVDASIMPGNSGGPVINGQGQVIGIVTLIVSGEEGGYGLNAVLPSSYVREFSKNNIEGY